LSGTKTSPQMFHHCVKRSTDAGPVIALDQPAANFSGRHRQGSRGWS
jgi:hypothetical protein